MDNVMRSPSPPAYLFDLKGSTVSRHAAEGDTVLKDEDLLRLFPTGLRVAGPDRVRILQQLAADVAWLRSALLMDYSLLVAVYDSTEQPLLLTGSSTTAVTVRGQTLLLGVIDFLQVFGVTKRLERAAKQLQHSSLALDISATDTDHYADRFLAFVNNVL